jgi:valyl-tRNA synthetase
MKSLTKFFESEKRETEIISKWQTEKLYKYDKNSESKSFKIDTPPPTVSGLLHMGHVFSYVQADIIARYKRMMGYNVFYPIGFDDNGLPTERLVEKITGKKVGKNFSKEEFVEECHKIVNESEKEFEALFKQIGLSVDFDLKYQTISDKTKKISQESFIDLYKKGLIYEKLAPVYFDVVDKTALAAADIEEKMMESQEITYKALIELENEKFAILPIMTTRPEMLPACVCVLYNPSDERYSKFEGKKVTLPTSFEKDKLHYKMEVPFIADKDVSIEKGTGVVMCCAFGDMQDKIWIERHKLSLIGNNLISDDGKLIDDLFAKEEGGYMKVEEGRKHIIEKLEEAALVVEKRAVLHAVKCGERSGKPVEILLKKHWYVSILPFKTDLLKVAEKIDFHPSHMKNRLIQWIEGLNQDWCISRDRFFGIEVPVIKIDLQDVASAENLELMKKELIDSEILPLIKKFGGKVNSSNDFEISEEKLHQMLSSKEFLDLENNLNEYCLHIKITSNSVNLTRDFSELYEEIKEELAKYEAIYHENNVYIASFEGAGEIEKHLAEYEEALLEKGIQMGIKTENLVLDTWFTSSVSPSIAWGDFEKTPIFDLRPQAHEIIRTWAFYTITKSYFHSLELKNKKPDAALGFNSREYFRMKEHPNIIPWKNVMLSGWCLAADKTKMSKSKGNVITPLDLIIEKGADSIRLWCGGSPLGADTAYSGLMLDSGKRFINKLWNVAKFVDLQFENLKTDAKITESFDKWILFRLSLVFSNYKKHMESFEYSLALKELDSFFWKDFCDNYMEIIKVRYYGLGALIYKDNAPANPIKVEKDQQSAILTIKTVFESLILLFAPFAPFINDDLYSIFFNKNVHEKGALLNFEIPLFENPKPCAEALKIIDEVRKFKTENSLAMNALIEEFKYKSELDLSEVMGDLKNVTGVKSFINFSQGVGTYP